MTDDHQTVLLIGGSGFLGSNLSRKLLDAGFWIIILDQTSPKFDWVSYGDRCHFVQGSHADSALLSKILSDQNVEIVIQLASRLLPGSSMEALCLDISENLEPGLRLFELIEKHGIRRYVYLSSGGTVYGQGENPHKETDPPRPLNYYGWLKLAMEEFIRLQARTTPMQYLIIRPSNPYGRFQKLNGRQGLVSVIFGRILNQRPLQVWGDGSVVRDYIYIDDFCASVLALLKQPVWNTTVNVGSGTGTSINELISLATDISGRPLQVEYAASRSVDAPSVVLDITKLRTLYSQPFRSIRQGMGHYWTELMEKSNS